MNNLDNNVAEIYRKTQPTPADNKLALAGLSQKVVAATKTESVVKGTVKKVLAFWHQAILWLGGWNYSDLQTLYKKYQENLSNVQPLAVAQREQKLHELAEQFTEDFIKTKNKEFNEHAFMHALVTPEAEGGVDLFGTMSVKKEELQLHWFKAVFQYMQKHETLDVLLDWGNSLNGDMKEIVFTYVAKQYIKGKQFEKAHEIMLNLSEASRAECEFLITEYSRNFIQAFSQDNAESVFFDKLKHHVPLFEEVQLWLGRLTDMGTLGDANKEIGTPPYRIRLSARLKREVLFGLDLRPWGPDAIRALLNYITPVDRVIFTSVNDWTDFVHQLPAPQTIHKKYAALCKSIAKLPEEAQTEILEKVGVVTQEAIRKSIMDASLKSFDKSISLKAYYSKFLDQLTKGQGEGLGILSAEGCATLYRFVQDLPLDRLSQLAGNFQQLDRVGPSAGLKIVQEINNLIKSLNQNESERFVAQHAMKRLSGTVVARYLHATLKEQTQWSPALLSIPKEDLLFAFTHCVSFWSRLEHDEEYSAQLVEMKSSFERLYTSIEERFSSPALQQDREEFAEVYYRLANAPLTALTKHLGTPDALTNPVSVERIKQQLSLLPSGSITEEKAHVLFASLLPFMDGTQADSYSMLIEIFDALYPCLTPGAVLEMGDLINNALYVQQVNMPDSAGYQPRVDDVFLSENAEKKEALLAGLSVYTKVGTPRNPPKVEGVEKLFQALEAKENGSSPGKDKIRLLVEAITQELSEVDIVSVFHAVMADPGRWSDDENPLVLLLEELDVAIAAAPETSAGLAEIRENGILGLLARVSQESQEESVHLNRLLYSYYVGRQSAGKFLSLAERRVFEEHDRAFQAELVRLRETLLSLQEKKKTRDSLKAAKDLLIERKKAGEAVSAEEIEQAREAIRQSAVEVGELRQILSQFREVGEPNKRILQLAKLEKDVAKQLRKTFAKADDTPKTQKLEENLQTWIQQVRVVRAALKESGLSAFAVEREVEMVVMQFMQSIIQKLSEDRVLSEEKKESLRSVFMNSLSKAGIKTGIGSFAHESVSSRSSEVAVGMASINKMSEVEGLIKKMSYVYDHEVNNFSSHILDGFVDRLSNILLQEEGNIELLERLLEKRSLSARLRYLLRASIVVAQVRAGKTDSDDVLKSLQPTLVERLRRSIRSKFKTKRSKHEALSTPKSQLREEQMELLARMLPASEARNVITAQIQKRQESLAQAAQAKALETEGAAEGDLEDVSDAIEGTSADAEMQPRQEVSEEEAQGLEVTAVSKSANMQEDNSDNS